MRDPATSSVKSAERALDILEALSRAPAGLSHTEISQALDIPKSSLTHLIRTMHAREFIAQDGTAKRYTLDPRVVLDADLTDDYRLARRATPLLAAITRETGESSALNVLQDAAARVIACVNSSHRLVSHMRIDDLAPLHATSGGKCILAHMTTADLEKYLLVGLTPVTDRTASSASSLLSELEEVRREGIARSQGEFTVGITGLAVPVVGPDGRVRAALNVAVPSVRYSRSLEKVASLALREAAMLLSVDTAAAPAASARRRSI